MTFDKKDLHFSYYNPNDRANGWALNPNVGVRALHVPTGVSVMSGTYSEVEANRDAALKRLAIAVAAFDPGISVNEASAVIEQAKADFNNGVVICRETWVRILEIASASLAAVKPVLKAHGEEDRAYNHGIDMAADLVRQKGFVCAIPADACEVLREEILALKRNPKE
jgi:hypothetical protein